MIVRQKLMATGLRSRSEQELQELAGAWPMKRLIAIWNSLPGVRPVEKFENRTIAIARIWRAIQPGAERKGESMARRTRARSSSRIAFRDGSKAAQVCTLLTGPKERRSMRSAAPQDGRRIRCAALSRALCGNRAGECGRSGKTGNVCTV